MLLAKSAVKVLCDFLRVHGKRSLYALFYVHNGGLLVHLKRQVGYLGEQEIRLVRRFVFNGHDVAFLHGLDGSHPLLVFRAGNVEYADVIVGIPPQFAVNPAAGCGAGNVIHLTRENLETVALGDGRETVFVIVYDNRCKLRLSAKTVPSHFGDEQFLEGGILDVLVE